MLARRVGVLRVGHVLLHSDDPSDLARLGFDLERTKRRASVRAKSRRFRWASFLLIEHGAWQQLSDLAVALVESQCKF